MVNVDNSAAAGEAPAKSNRGALCPICGASSRPYCDKYRHGYTWHLFRCEVCGHGFVSNRPTAELLAEIYGKDDQSHLAWNPEDITAHAHEQRPDCSALVAQVVRLAGQRGPSLDVGAGDGAFSYHLARQGFVPTLIDLDPRARQAARALNFANFELTTFEDFSDRALAASPARRFDVIVMSQVLEHALDPMDWLKRAAQILTPEGVLAVAVPNFGGLYRLLGARDPFIIPPIHLNFFTPASIRLAFSKAGLNVCGVRSISRIGLSRRGGIKGLARKMMQAGWNVASRPLNWTARGIILQAYGKPTRPATR